MSTSAEKRAFGLDLIRSIAIILVLFNHSVQLMEPVITVPHIGKLFGKFLALFQPVGMLGVELFFVLSGFLIGNILLKVYISEKEFSFVSIATFWKRRWFRTLPAYFLILTLLFLLAGKFIWKYYFFIQCATSKRIYFFAESWSLPIEEWFYLLLPVMLFTFDRFCKKFSKQQVFLTTVLVFILLFTFLRILVVGIADNSYNAYTQIRNMTFLRLDAIGYGVLLAYMSQFRRVIFLRFAKPLLLISATLMCFLVAIYYLGTHPSFLYYDKLIWFKWIEDRFLFTLIPILLCLSLPYASVALKTKFNTFNKFIELTSKISYSLYLLHATLILDYIFKPLYIESPLGSIFIFLAYLTACYTTSYLMYRFFEVPTTNLRNYNWKPMINKRKLALTSRTKE